METVVGPLHHQQRLAETEPLARFSVSRRLADTPSFPTNKF
jgi:hypothetical protein